MFILEYSELDIKVNGYKHILLYDLTE